MRNARTFLSDIVGYQKCKRNPRGRFVVYYEVHIGIRTLAPLSGEESPDSRMQGKER